MCLCLSPICQLSFFQFFFFLSVLVGWEFELRTLHLLSRCSTAEPHFQSSFLVLKKHMYSMKPHHENVPSGPQNSIYPDYPDH
jgi:hypothetical protein